MRTSVLLASALFLLACDERRQLPTPPTSRRSDAGQSQDGGHGGGDAAGDDARARSDAEAGDDAGGDDAGGDDARARSDAEARDTFSGPDADVNIDAMVTRDVGFAPDATTPDDCRLGASCTGLTYCDSTSGHCVPGCSFSGQCSTNETCNIATHSCLCVPQATICLGACATCPSDPGVTQTSCAGAQCVATRCSGGYSLCGSTCCMNAAPTWHVELATSEGGSSSSLAIGASGVPAIAYFADSTRGIHYIARQGASWSAPETVISELNAMTPQLSVSGGTPIVLSSVSNISSAWTVTSRRGTNGIWSADPQVIGPDRSDFAVGGGVEFLAGLIMVSGGSSSLVGSYRPAGSTTWATTSPLADGVGWSYPKLAAAPDGTMFALYTMSNNQLWVAGSIPARQLTTTQAWDYDIAIDSNSTLHIVYYSHDSAQIIYETWSAHAATMTRQAIVENAGGAPPGSSHYAGLSIAVAQGRAHVAYLDFTRGAPVLRYAVDNGGFVPETVANADDVLGSTSIAVDSTGAPHISFPYPAPSFTYLGYAVKR